MAKPKTKPVKTEAEDWLQKIDRAKSVREKWRRDFRAGLAYDYWEGRQRPPHISANEWITINMIFSTLAAELPSLYSSDPYFYISLKRSFSPNPMDIALYDQKAKIRQAMLNYLRGEGRLKPKARLAIFDAYFQYGTIKVHLAADLIENPDAGDPIIDEETNIGLLGENDQPLVQPDFLPANQMYRIERIHPDDFLVDEDAGPLDEDVNWKAHRIKKPIEDVKADKKYAKRGRDAVQPTEIKGEAEKEREQRKKGGVLTGEAGKEPDICVLWEVWDRKSKKWLTIAEGCKEFLTAPADIPEGTEQDPFIDIRFNLRDDSWYPLPPVSQWIDPQREYCESRSKRITHRKRFNRKYECYTGAFDNATEAMAMLENGEDGTVLPKNQPMQAIHPIAEAPLDQQEMVELSYLRQDFADLAGQGPNQRGSTQGVDSATEAGLLEKNSQVREGDKRGVVKDFLIDIARKLDQLVQAHITQDQAVKVTGPQGEVWEMVRVQDYDSINGEYEYNIDAGSTLPQLPEIQRAQWIQFIGSIATFPQLLMSRSFIKKSADMFQISDEVMVDELCNIGEKMMSGQIPSPGNTGSAPGSGEQNPLSAIGGMALGMNNIRGGA